MIQLRRTYPALLGFALLLITPLSAEDLSLNEVLLRYEQAMGGRSLLQDVKSMRLTGTIRFKETNQSADLLVIKKRPNYVRMQFSFEPGITLTQAYDGTHAWRLPPRTPRSQAALMSAEESLSFTRDAPIESPLLNASEHGVTLELLGVESLSGLDCYVIRASYDEESWSDYYVDTVDFIERQIVSPRYTDGEVQLQRLIPGDYKRVESIMVAYQVISWLDDKRESVLTIDEVRFNVGVLGDYFTFPVEADKPASE